MSFSLNTNTFFTSCVSRPCPTPGQRRKITYRLVLDANGKKELEDDQVKDACPNCHTPINTKNMKQWLDYVNLKKRKQLEGISNFKYEKRKKQNKKGWNVVKRKKKERIEPMVAVQGLSISIALPRACFGCAEVEKGKKPQDDGLTNIIDD